MIHSHLKLTLCMLATCALTVSCKKNQAGDTSAAGSGSSVAAAGSGSSEATPPAPAGCAAGHTLLEGPQICVATPDGFVKPLDLKNSKDPTHGNLNVSYSADGTSGGKFVATFTVTYNAAPSSPINWTYFEQDAAEYCDSPPKLEDIADGHGKYFSCPSKKLDGHTLAKSKIATAKNLIDCQGQSDNKPEIDAVCKTLKQN